MQPAPDFSQSPSGAIGHFAVAVEPLTVDSSLYAASCDLVDFGFGALPVVDESGVYVGMISEHSVVRALADGMNRDTPLRNLIERVPGLTSQDTWSSALRALADSPTAVLPVLDGSGHVVGIVTPSRLVAPVSRPPLPRPVGGMATPLGVYLTNGVLRGGAGSLGLILAGVSLFGLFMLGQLLVRAGLIFTVPTFYQFAWGRPVLEIGGLLMFLILLRLTPIAGYHAAEHMVVHAIERGEPLDPNIVRRMPRVHPRCGTNLAVAAMLFLGIFMTEWVPDPEVRFLAAMLVTLFFWRPVGSFVQYYFTTRPPNEKQLQSGIKAGRELVGAYQQGMAIRGTTFTRLARSGMFHVIAGSMIAGTLFYLLQSVLNVPPAWQVL